MTQRRSVVKTRANTEGWDGRWKFPSVFFRASLVFLEASMDEKEVIRKVHPVGKWQRRQAHKAGLGQPATALGRARPWNGLRSDERSNAELLPRDQVVLFVQLRTGYTLYEPSSGLFWELIQTQRRGFAKAHGVYMARRGKSYGARNTERTTTSYGSATDNWGHEERGGLCFDLHRPIVSSRFSHYLE
ncbi:uncharacterized protein LY79DRAFT_576809 [Colletotrichum navitas]|uniref:Uncharacterized protein n=1 Tax=Colletotrichum navitas TaxID=681940 RepID=A0AAD8V8L6_9PEZI|nr:uncharacterized protein LY79DRAFT_576809 [Colletotrichum navitas]KAK1597049.1 hypothetical protein LY79DRAFT_576809 [Colletotrichum navitas]